MSPIQKLGTLAAGIATAVTAWSSHAAAPDRGEDPDRHADQVASAAAISVSVQGQRRAFGECCGDGLVEEDAIAEIAARATAEEAEVLQRQRRVEAEAGAQRGDVRGGRAGPSMTAAGSPGMTWAMTNTIAATSMTATIPPRRRRM